jgi:proteasome lid subunit RPN8/RPN11
MRVLWPKPLQRRWHRECAQGWPHERFAYLIGHKQADIIEIEHLYIPADVAAYATRRSVETPNRWYFAALDEAAQEAAQVVGDIHSHPRTFRNWKGSRADATPSEGDFAAGWVGICGITVAAEQRSGLIRCRTRFYPPAERVKIL